MTIIMKKYIKPIVCITAIQSELVVCTSIKTGGEQENVDAEVTRRKDEEFEDDELLDEELIQDISGWKGGLW